MKLSDVDHAKVRMVSIQGLILHIALDDYSSLEFKFRTEAELSHEFEAWTKADTLKVRGIDSISVAAPKITAGQHPPQP